MRRGRSCEALFALMLVASVHCDGGPTGVTPDGGGATSGSNGSGSTGGSGDSGSGNGGGSTGGSGSSGSSTMASGDGGPGCALPIPAKHVAEPFGCAITGYPADAAAMSCTRASDCSDGSGPMVPGVGTVGWTCLGGQCTLSDCASNRDCTDAGICSCQGSTFGYAGSSYGNVCVRADCRSDSDCGPGRYCSPTLMGGPFYGIQGYYCHTCSDECTNDSDCGDGGGCSYCAYDPTVGHWACSHFCSAG
jgi:hypothetical protein